MPAIINKLQAKSYPTSLSWQKTISPGKTGVGRLNKEFYLSLAGNQFWIWE
jgi:hypothetical protein